MGESGRILSRKIQDRWADYWRTNGITLCPFANSGKEGFEKWIDRAPRRFSFGKKSAS